MKPEPLTILAMLLYTAVAIVLGVVLVPVILVYHLAFDPD